MKVRSILLAIVLLCAFTSHVAAEEQKDTLKFLSDLDFEFHGFYEMRAGYRLRKNKYEKDMSLMENRLQLDLSRRGERADIKIKGDFLGDLVEEQGTFDLREANVLIWPAEYMDIKIGRQVLTWGTGDLIFINDLFPKDWQSFFIGRDMEYLKAPSDAVKISLFSDFANLDIVYTPKFDPDRYITGERISYWNSLLGREAGNDAVIHTDKPNQYFRDSEIAARLYKNINNYELAFYGYRGYWKSPGGFNSTMTQAIFPDLNVYGSSIRGAVGEGIGNAEFGYYESDDDQSGTNGLINNSELRFLVGYTQELARDFTAAVQYYVERIMDYGNHIDSSPAGLTRDRNRHLLTLRLTQLLMNQNLRCSIFTYFSPSDKDVYIRPNANYKVSDNLAVELGANIFFGDYPDTFFGQFENNTNIYTGFRYSF